MRTTKEVLTEARSLIEKGWCQGTPMTDDGMGNRQYCITAALRQSCDMLKFGNQLWAAREAVMKFLPTTYSYLFDERRPKLFITWNDAPERTQQDVLDILDKAIESL